MTEKLNVHQRLAKAMEEVDYIQKERKSGMNYTIVSHDAVTAKVRPVLLKNGIVYYPIRCEHSHDGNRAECSMSVRFVNIDDPSDHFDVPTFGYGIDPQDKGPGKAMSYAVKYALLKALGLETGDDPDHDSIPHEPAPKQEPKPAMYNTLVAELKKGVTKEDLNRMWKDAEFIALRQTMPEHWQEKLRDAASDIGKSKPSERDTVQDIQDAFPGSKVTNERITDVSGRELEYQEAGE